MANFKIVGGGDLGVHVNDPNILLPSNVIITPTLLNGFTNVGNRTIYYKIGTKVFISIALQKGSTAFTTETAFTLPTGYRPPRDILNSATSEGGDKNAFIKVFTTGEVKARSYDYGCYGIIIFDAFA